MCFNDSNLIVVISILIIMTPVRIITFYIILVNTPFLFYWKDIDKLKVFFNNTRNEFIKRIINGKKCIKVF